MISYRIAKGSVLIIEEGTTASPNGSGLTFEVSGLQYATLGDAVNASSVPIKNLWSGTAFLDNRAQTFYGQNTFTQPLVAQQAVNSSQLATLGQVASYGSLSGISSDISGIQTLAIGNQSNITVLTSNFSGFPINPINNILASNQSGINSSLGTVQLKTTTLENNFSGLPTGSNSQISGVQSLAVNNQGRISVLTSNQSGIDLRTKFTGILKGNGLAGVKVALPGVDYTQAIGSIVGIIKCDGSNNFSAATPNGDYVSPVVTNSILKGDGSGGVTAASPGMDFAVANINQTQINTNSSVAGSNGTFQISTSLGGSVTIAGGIITSWTPAS